LGLTSGVWFGLGRPVAPLLACADLLLMPSLYEPLGMAQIEALGLGVPVLASDVGGIPETVQHERSGWLVPAGNGAAWAQAVEAGLAALPSLRRLAESGREDVQARFGIDANTESVLRLLMRGESCQSQPYE
jgi:glycosyltransferase involved in cell wall biosynthesis